MQIQGHEGPGDLGPRRFGTLGCGIWRIQDLEDVGPQFSLLLEGELWPNPGVPSPAEMMSPCT